MRLNGGRTGVPEKDGQIIYGRPTTTLGSRRPHFRNFMAAGRPVPKHAERQERRTMTLDELRRLVETGRSAADADVAAS
jgi:hypothetical protein